MPPLNKEPRRVGLAVKEKQVSPQKMICIFSRLNKIQTSLLRANLFKGENATPFEWDVPLNNFQFEPFSGIDLRTRNLIGTMGPS
jgi:hypothetical protein